MDGGYLAPEAPAAQVEIRKGGCEPLLLAVSSQLETLKVPISLTLPSWLKLNQGQEDLSGWVRYPPLSQVHSEILSLNLAPCKEERVQ